MAMASHSSSPHFVIMPFMSKGHTIPLLHLTHLLLRRNISVTILTTHANSPFVRQSLAGTKTSIIDLSFPQNDVIPPGVESTEKLPSMALFVPFVNATKLLQPEFERVLESLQPSVSCIISGAFLPWSLESATKLGIPRLAFNGMSNFAMIVSTVVARDRLYAGLDSDDEPFTVPNFPWIKLTKNDYEKQFLDPDPNSPFFKFFQEQAKSTANSMGLIVNSIYELEQEYADYWNSVSAPNKSWYVGPLCLAAEPPTKLKVQTSLHKPIWVQWIDEMLAKGRPVLYVAFGSQADITIEQLREIAIGLDDSRANFLWVVKSSKGEEDEFMDGFEERVKGRGLVALMGS
ncbi:UDP-glucuronosyl/UDP-glucosyltransferase [Macleaya cordata]|uniref:UDP-glucuronosyl/UDP-glucosyltransferase n=1 Tax=Macleaya cordata TaxID=56857 RepID=A0A200QAU8_MACCD|nr:UDP-glucuronosyl/UDP-glucosyltransferase [Macleaya cordata]